MAKTTKTTATIFIGGNRDTLLHIISKVCEIPDNKPTAIKLTMNPTYNPSDDTPYSLVIRYDQWANQYDKAIDTAKLALGIWPEADMTALFTDDEEDRCGGYADHDPTTNQYSWTVTPSDWEAYLEGNFQNTSQATKRQNQQ